MSSLQNQNAGGRLVQAGRTMARGGKVNPVVKRSMQDPFSIKGPRQMQMSDRSSRITRGRRSAPMMKKGGKAAPVRKMARGGYGASRGCPYGQTWDLDEQKCIGTDRQYFEMAEGGRPRQRSRRPMSMMEVSRRARPAMRIGMRR